MIANANLNYPQKNKNGLTRHNGFVTSSAVWVFSNPAGGGEIQATRSADGRWHLPPSVSVNPKIPVPRAPASAMNPFDILISVILGYSLVRGLFRGLVKELSSIIGVLGGFYAAYTYYMVLARLLSGLIKDPVYLNILSFLIIFCLVLIFVSILGVIIKYLLNITFLGWVDRIGGVGFGIVKGILIVSILFITLTAFLPKGTPFIKNSALAPHVSWFSEKMAKAVSKEMKRDFVAKLEELKKAWKIRN